MPARWPVVLVVATLFATAGCTSSAGGPTGRGPVPGLGSSAEGTVQADRPLTLESEGVTAVIPGAAAQTGTVAHLGPVDPVAVPSAASGLISPLGRWVSLDLSGQQPSAPVQLTLPVPDGTDGEHLVLLSQHDGSLRAYPGSYDAAAHTFTAKVDALSIFGIAFVNPVSTLNAFRKYLGQALTGRGTPKPGCFGKTITANGLAVGVGGQLKGPLWPCVSPASSGVTVAVTNSDTLPWSIDSGLGSHDLPAEASIEANITTQLGAVMEAAWGSPRHGILLPGDTQTWSLPMVPDGKGVPMRSELSISTWLSSAIVFAALFLTDVFAGTEKAAAKSLVKVMLEKGAAWECLVGAATKLGDTSAMSAGKLLSITRAALGCVGPIVEALGGSLGALASMVLDVLTAGAAVIAGGVVGLFRSITGSTTQNWYVGYGDWILPNVSTGTTTLTFTTPNCDGCEVVAYRALNNPTTVETWGPVVVHGTVATLRVPTSKTRNMAFSLSKPDPGVGGQPYGSSNAVAVVILGYQGVSPGTSVGAAQALRATRGNWCWAGTQKARETIRISYDVFYDADLASTFGGTYGDHSITEWASPALPVVGGYPLDLYHGGAGHQDAPYCH